MDNNLYYPKYTSLDEVKLELSDKITFRNNDSKYVSDNEVLDNIEDAESIIELKLSRQYLIPFQGIDSNGILVPFDQIPNKAARKYVAKVALLQSCILLMQTLFGKDEGVRGTTYLKNYQDQLEDQLHYVIGKDKKSGEYLYPPMPGLASNNKASFFRAGIQSPLVCKVGEKSNSIGNQVISRLPNPVANWNFWVALNDQKNFNGS